MDDEDDYDFPDDPITKWQPQVKVPVPTKPVNRPWGLRHFRKPGTFIEQAIPESRDELPGLRYGGTLHSNRRLSRSGRRPLLKVNTIRRKTTRRKKTTGARGKKKTTRTR